MLCGDDPKIYTDVSGVVDYDNLLVRNMQSG